MILWFMIMAASVIFSLAALAFWIWMLVDCLQNEPPEGNEKIIWTLVIVLTNWIGALIYYFVRRPQRMQAKRQHHRHGPRRHRTRQGLPPGHRQGPPPL